MTDPYAALARFYDLDHADFGDDLDLWRSLARSAGGAVLEIGCGSGRVLVPLARAGFTVVGVDSSGPMLDRARARLASDPRLARRVTLIEADVRRLELPQPGSISLAIASLGVFGHLADHAAVLAALARLRTALRPDGLLAVDLPNPLTLVDDQPDGVVFHDWTRTDSATGRTIQRFHSRRTDPVAQTVETTFLYDELASDGTVRRHPAPVMLRWFSAPELELLLLAGGFAVDGFHGDWELGDYGADSPRLIALARPAV